MSATNDPIDSQLDAAGILLSNAELLPATLETELRLYCERLAAARAEQTLRPQDPASRRRPRRSVRGW